MQTLEIDLSSLDFPLVLRPSSPVTDEQLISFSERNKPYKIERNKDGDLVIMTPVGGIGSIHEFYVSSRFSVWVYEDGTGVGFSPNAGFKLPDGTTLSPDAAWLPLTKWKTLTQAQQKTYPPFCPEFLIEVRSESDSRRMVEAKMQTWMDNGAQLAWLVDPIDASVTIYRPGQEPETLLRPESITATAPVAGFTLPCTRLWTTD
jgi:Uma2 family endonuclease